MRRDVEMLGQPAYMAHGDGGLAHQVSLSNEILKSQSAEPRTALQA